MEVHGGRGGVPLRERGSWRSWAARLVAKPRFQELAARLPVARRIARRDGQEIFDILQGFVASQVLSALVELGLLRQLLEDGPQTAANLAFRHDVPAHRMQHLLQAGAAIGLLKRRRSGDYAIARKGAAILGVPGLEGMIAHNRELYADLADPVSVLREEGQTRLAQFWPYVLGGGDGIGPDVAEKYSALMADSQLLVARDTLGMLPLNGPMTLLDVGGGSGVFLGEVLRRNAQANGMLFDLPQVMPAAQARREAAGLTGRLTLHGGSFREDELPRGADVISLIRVLYDHSDETVTALLRKVYEALPPGGRLIVSEPMSGGARPERAGDVYFAFYTMAMGTGQVRSAERIVEMCKTAGFTDPSAPAPRRAFITSAVSCVKPT
ncbi:MAG: methyltransferase [Pseudomonadota bacterium]